MGTAHPTDLRSGSRLQLGRARPRGARRPEHRARRSACCCAAGGAVHRSVGRSGSRSREYGCEAGLLIGSRQWPLLAACMQQLGEQDGTDTVAQHLNRLTTSTSWQEATGTALVGRLVDATFTSPTTPPGAPALSRPRFSAAAARSHCLAAGHLPRRA
ncbi:hypothetical protein [Streptomyces erythrochromogenes]|uniref:hypothetical protein n=1 Tax=Streptomyces erythrochromogenes TaxID=285574 RepID=UPI0036983D07